VLPQEDRGTMNLVAEAHRAQEPFGDAEAASAEQVQRFSPLVRDDHPGIVRASPDGG
jgi:hypothetical protein